MEVEKFIPERENKGCESPVAWPRWRGKASQGQQVRSMRIGLKTQGSIQKAMGHPDNTHSATSTRTSLVGSPQKVGGEPS